MTAFVWLLKIKARPESGGDHDRPTTQEQQSTTTRPRLEQLEDRLAPATFGTITDVTIWTNPSFSGHGIERLTANVSQAGTGTPVTSGNVVFSVNNIPIASVPLDSSGFAQIDTPMPLSALATNQTVQAVYEGATVGTNTFSNSVFSSPVFLNVWNALVTSFIDFPQGPLTQSTVPGIIDTDNNGETNALLFFQMPSPTGEFFAIINYVDPGVITGIASFSPML